MGYYSSMIVLIPAIIISFYAQAKLKSAYGRYAQVVNSKGITGREAAAMILRSNGLESIPVQQVQGSLTDHYDPRKKTLSLSEGVYDTPSIAAIGIAAHECGHALQDSSGYTMLKIRNSIVPAVNIGSFLSWPILILGIFLGALQLQMVGVVLFAAVIVFHLVTLPVEIDASRRAVAMLSECGIISSDSDMTGVKAVLKAAALTYIAALASSVASLIRMLLIIRGSRR